MKIALSITAAAAALFTAGRRHGHVRRRHVMRACRTRPGQHRNRTGRMIVESVRCAAVIVAASLAFSPIAAADQSELDEYVEREGKAVCGAFWSTD